MQKVTGLGGIFIKSKDPATLKKWYIDNLGIGAGDYGFNFIWSESPAKGEEGFTIWSLFPSGSDYFAPSSSSFMINYRVADLTGLAELLKTDGVQFVDEIQDSPYGKFLHIMDPEGNKIELWEPKAE